MVHLQPTFYVVQKTGEMFQWYETICAAIRGDPDAMTEVLQHFDGYISYQATRIFYDEYGQSYRGVDAELKQRIQDKLVARIMARFRPE